jgi:IS1 family transposase
MLTSLKWTSCTASSREKNRFYAITLVSRDTREIVGFDIAFDKSRERIQRLVDRSVKAHQYYSDAYLAYAEVRYEGTHTSLKNKSQTYTIEGVNSDLRYYIPALHRRSKCFFRSLETAKAVFKIFVNAFKLFACAKKNFPHLKSAFCLSSFI